MKISNKMNSRTILENFRQNTSVTACRYLFERSKFERFFWISCLLIGIASIAFITVDILSDWASESVYITLDAFSRKITEVDFPGVAICDINHISKRRASELAYNLANYTVNRNFNETLELVKLLGNLYDFNMNRANEFSKLQEILNSYSNASLILRLSSLMTPCEDLLTNCSWNSEEFNCTDLFGTRLTDSGFCCLFNYVRYSPEVSLLKELNNDIPNQTKKFLGTGVGSGLSVTINNNLSDYFYTSMATRGCLVKIFLPGDFPDLSSGSLRQIIVQERSEVYISVEADTLKTFPQVRALPKEQRKCKFSDEEGTEFGHYTSSNCFVSCKLKSIQLLCNCVPFMMRLSNKTNRDDSVCNLVDIPCLSRYQGKWLRYYPFEAVDEGGLNLDFEDSLFCNGCLPNCNDVLYSIDTNYIDFYSEDFDNYPNSSRIHVYSNKAYTNYYKKFLTVTWYESLSTFGGIVSLLLGMSIINFVEIGVLLVKLLVYKIKGL